MAFRGETSACHHNRCGLCPISTRSPRAQTLAAWAVDVGIDRILDDDQIATPQEVNGVARELANDYQISELQGQIAGAMLLGMNGDCPSKQFEMDKLAEGVIHGKDF